MAFTDKAIKSKASLAFADQKDRTGDLNNTEPRLRKGTNRSLSGNPFGERITATKHNSASKETQLANLVI